MDCREVQRLIIPFIKNELSIDQAKALFQHIDHCQDCTEEIELYYIMLVGLKELDEGNEQSLSFHEQFEEHLRQLRLQISKQQLKKTPKIILLLALVAVLLVIVTSEQEQNAKKQIDEKQRASFFTCFHEFFMNDVFQGENETEIKAYKHTKEYENNEYENTEQIP